MTRLVATFQVEAREHIVAMNSGIASLAESPDDGEIVERVFREAHSLKGASRAVNLREIESACQILESMLSEIRQGNARITPDFISEIRGSVGEIAGMLPGLVAAPEETGIPAKRNIRESVRVRVDRLEKVMLRAEETMYTRLFARQRLDELESISEALSTKERKWAEIRDLIDSLESAPSQAEWSRLRLCLEAQMQAARSLKRQASGAKKHAARDWREGAAMVDGLLEDIREMLLQPFSSLSESFPGLVEGLASESGKEISLEIRGGDIEIDRRVLEEMKDPLIHLIRNAADHGIESPSVRRGRGKPASGRISVSLVEAENGKVWISVSDDGEGVNLAKVKAASSRLGIDGGDALSLMFRSGVSTSDAVTEISGRGVGLAIVEEKLEKLGGRVSVETAEQKGTTFRLEVPHTLATFRAILVGVSDRKFAIPLHHAERVIRLKRSDLVSLNGREVFDIGGKSVSWAMLKDLLMIGGGEGDGNLQAIIVGRENGVFALGVDRIFGEQEIVVRMLGKQLARVRNISGACILAGGEVVPILNVSDLVKSAAKVESVSGSVKRRAKEKHILVVEDSITSRTLMKNILESGGYRVKTAVDGMDALAALKMESFDIVVSDVDMPRLDGFGLTGKIRADSALEKIPVVLVTSLGNPEHRAQGMEAGANAYIVKSSFDQSDLFSAIERLT